jgi:hypothetical protein
VVDLSLFPDFIDGMRQILVQDSMVTSLDCRVTTTCASLLAAGLFIGSQSLVGDGASSDQAMVEARCLFQRSSRRRWSLAAAASFGKCGSPKDGFIIFLSFWILSAMFLGQLFFSWCVF